MRRARWVGTLVGGTLALGGPGDAHATLVSGSVKLPGTDTTLLTVNVSSPPVEQLTEGDTQLLDEVGDLTCPALGDAGCALGALDFVFVSELETGGDPIVRRQVAVANVPTPLNVDGDLLPDLIGTLQVLSLTEFRLRVDRVLGEVSPLPLKLEAVVDDPSGGALPRERLHAGFDARGSITPVTWTTVARLPEDGDPGLTTLDTETSVVGAGPTIATVGGLFDGDPADRRDPIGGRLRHTPVPPTTTFGLSLGTYLEVRAGASAPTTADAAAEIVDGPREQRADVEITALPQQLRVRNVQLAPDRRAVTYASTAPVARLDARYRDTLGGDLTTAATVAARDLPLGMTLEQLSARSATFAATSPLGSVEVGYGDGREPVLLDADHPYARVVQDVPDGPSSYAGRIDELQFASVDATDGVVADLQLGPDGRKPLRALVELPGLTIDGHLSDLPRRTTLRYAPADGRVEYDASGETIREIRLDAVQDTPFFGRVRQLRGRIADLPSQATVDIRPEGGGFRLETSDRIGEAEALLTSGPGASLPPGVLGAAVEDLPTRFTAVARVQGLRLLDVERGAGRRVAGRIRLDPTPLRLRYDKQGFDGDLHLDAELSAVPDDVSVALDPEEGTLDYDASGPIERIDATVTSATPFFGRVERIAGTVEDLPAQVGVAFKRPFGSGLRLSTTEPIGDAEVLLSSGPDASLPAGVYGAQVRDVPDRFTAVARVTGLRLLDVLALADGSVLAEARLGRTPLSIAYTQQDGDGDLQVDAELSHIPSQVKVAFQPGDGIVDYEADAPLKELRAEITSSAPFFGRVTRISGHVNDLPADVTLSLRKPEGQSGLLVSTTEPVGDTQVLLSSGPDGALAPDELGAAIEDLPDRFTAAARVRGLRLVDVTTGPGRQVAAQIRLASQPLALHYDAPGLAVDAALSDVPQEVALAFDPDEGRVDYDASAGIASIDASVEADAPLFGRVASIRARVLRLPPQVTIGFKPQSGSGAAFTATPAVGMIDATLSDGNSAHPPLPEGQSGLKMLSTGHHFQVQGRLYEVSGASVTVGDGGAIDAQLDTGSLPGGLGRQDLHLDLTIDELGDAVHESGRITAFVDDLPGTLRLRQNGGSITYDASAPVPLVTLDATHLPGEELHGAVHEVRGRLVGVPAQFTIRADDSVTGIDAATPFERIDLEAWDEGDQREPLPEDGRNKVMLDLQGGDEDDLYAQVRVFDLEKVQLRAILGTEIETAFGSAPAPLDVALETGHFSQPTDLAVTVDDLPVSSTFGVSDLNGLKLTWDAASAGTDVDLKLASDDVGANLQIPNLPDQVELCVGGGAIACSPDAPQVVRVDPGVGSSITDVLFPNAFTLVADASATMRLDGKICLRHTNHLGDPIESESGEVGDDCLPGGSSPNRLLIDDLRLRDMRLEFAGGDSVSVDEDDDPIEDDLIKLYVDSDERGLTVDAFDVINDATDEHLELSIHEDAPLRNSAVGHPFFRLWDMTIPPSTEDDTPVQGRLDCVGTKIWFKDLVPVLETDVAVPLALLHPFLDFCGDVE